MTALPQTRKPKVHIAQFKELGGPLNPTGIIDANFLILSRALETGDAPENVQQALYDWLGNLPAYKRVTPEQLDSILALGPEKAFAAVVQKIGGGLNPETLPPKPRETLQKALAYTAKKYTQRRGQEISKEIGHLRGIKRAYRGEALVAWFLRAAGDTV